MADRKVTKTPKEGAGALVPVASFILFVNTLVKTETSPCSSASDGWIFWFCAIGFIAALVKSLFQLLSMAIDAAEADEPDPRWQKGKMVYFFRDADDAKDDAKVDVDDDAIVDVDDDAKGDDAPENAIELDVLPGAAASRVYCEYVVEGENSDGTHLLIRLPDSPPEAGVIKVRKTRLLFPAPDQNPATSRCNKLLKFNQRYIVSVANLLLAICLGSITFAVDSRTSELTAPQCAE
uniref:Transmembrane protein n=1 Tax=Marseillevirus LCMAC103 TaxID=2506604 RepID=A0A481YWG1_9VIRU|nr:MAG: hypothetical protein LCMAC103_02420 [Marseillevirus LCMAC103]